MTQVIPEEFKQLQAARDRLEKGADAAKLERLDGFGRWLFLSVAVISTLATGFTLNGTPTLAGLGRQLFPYVVALLAIALGLATVAQIPRGQRYNPNNLDSVEEALRRASAALRWKTTLLAIAGLLFGLCLAAAAVAFPLSSVSPVLQTPVAVHAYTFTDGSLNADVSARGIPARAWFLVVLREGSDTPCLQGKVLASARAAANSDGMAVVTQKVKTAPTNTCIRAEAGEEQAAETQWHWAWVLPAAPAAAPQLSISYALSAEAIAVSVSGAQLAPASQLRVTVGSEASPRVDPCAAATVLASGSATVAEDRSAKVDLGVKPPTLPLCVVATAGDGQPTRWRIQAP